MTVYLGNKIAQQWIDSFDLAYEEGGKDLGSMIVNAKQDLKAYKGQIQEDVRQELKYRIDAVRGQLGIRQKELKNTETIGDLKNLVDKWQDKHRWVQLSWKGIENKLDPRLVKRLVRSESLREKFIRFVLVYRCGESKSLEIFKKQACFASNLEKYGLVSFVGEHGGIDQKLQIRCNGKMTSIYDAQVRDIFNKLKRYNHKDRDRELEYIYGDKGLIQFNRYLHGHHGIDLNDPKYYEQLPKTGIKKTRSELQKVIPDEKIKSDEWVILIRAYRETDQIATSGSHSWIEIYKPGWFGSYDLLMSAGLWQKSEMKTSWDHFQAIGGIIPGTVSVVERAVYDKVKETRTEGFNVSKETGERFLQKTLRDKLIDAEKGQLPFQATDRNCMAFSCELMSQVTPAVRMKERIPLPEVTTHLYNAVHDRRISGLVAFMQKAYSWVAHALFWMFNTLSGQYRKFQTRDKVITGSEGDFVKKQVLYLPAQFVASQGTRT